MNITGAQVLLTRFVVPSGELAPQSDNQEQFSPKVYGPGFRPKYKLTLARIEILLETLLPRKSAKPTEIQPSGAPIAKSKAPKKQPGKSSSLTRRKKKEWC
jgi:hypothetical protein